MATLQYRARYYSLGIPYSAIRYISHSRHDENGFQTQSEKEKETCEKVPNQSEKKESTKFLISKKKKKGIPIKGALDKYNIHLFVSISVENFKLTNTEIFPADSANAFSFDQNIIFQKFRVSVHVYPIGYCIVYLLKLTFKNRKWKNIHVTLSMQSLLMTTRYKNPNFLKKLRDDV